MSTDTAFALGMLALVGSGFPDPLRVFLLTLSIVDDVVGLIVIGTVYSSRLVLWPFLLAVGLFAAIFAAARVGVHRGVFYAGFGVAAWAALLASGIDPIVIGLAMGLLTSAAPAGRGDLERASDLFRLFREQPTPALERTARVGLRSAISPNERLQRLYHPWTSYLIVPLFALANAGVKISGSFLSSAFTSPLTLGVLIGSVVGKPLGVVGGSWLVTRMAGPASPADRLGGPGRRRNDRRDRLHGVVAYCESCLPRDPARGGEARDPDRRVGRIPCDLDGVSR
jgi:Na+/H+ antiporter NhaA